MEALESVGADAQRDGASERRPLRNVGRTTLLDDLAFSQDKAGDFEGAVKTAQAALAVDPDDAAALAAMAFAHGSRGDRPAMLSALGRAAALDPRFKRSLMSAMSPPPDAVFLFPGEPEPAGVAELPLKPPRQGRDAPPLGWGAWIGAAVLSCLSGWALSRRRATRSAAGRSAATGQRNGRTASPTAIAPASTTRA